MSSVIRSTQNQYGVIIAARLLWVDARCPCTAISADNDFHINYCSHWLLNFGKDISIELIQKTNKRDITTVTFFIRVLSLRINWMRSGHTIMAVKDHITQILSSQNQTWYDPLECGHNVKVYRVHLFSFRIWFINVSLKQFQPQNV